MNGSTAPTRPAFTVYAWGLVSASVCTSLDDAAATAAINDELPTGISSQWEVADAPAFADGTPHPCPCPDSEEHRHVLFHC